jgi:uncharacterized integral membrane protein
MHRFRLSLSTVLVGLLLILILQNMVTVEIKVFWWTIAMPQALLLVITAMGGFVVGMLAGIKKE